MTTEPEPMAYVAIAPCGCVKMATVDTPERKETNAKEIAACVKDGYTIERKTCAWVRENWVSSCDLCRRRKKAKPAEQGVLGL
jgi:uncharacterized OsmC-like protein